MDYSETNIFQENIFVKKHFFKKNYKLRELNITVRLKTKCRKKKRSQDFSRDIFFPWLNSPLKFTNFEWVSIDPLRGSLKLVKFIWKSKLQFEATFSLLYDFTSIILTSSNTSQQNFASFLNVLSWTKYKKFCTIFKTLF